MKYLFALLVAMLISINSYSTNGPSFSFLEPFEDYFEESDIFVEGASFLWIEYQLVSNRLSRPDKSGVIIPPIGISYEKRVFHNLGVRMTFGLNYWKEDKILFTSAEQDFNQDFKYFYNTLALGVTWHITINDWIDPYVGISYSYRHIYARCDCLSESKAGFNVDFFLGARLLMSERFYFNGEIGHSGTGYFKFGLGIILGDI